jgi:hypothetical protein
MGHPGFQVLDAILLKFGHRWMFTGWEFTGCSLLTYVLQWMAVSSMASPLDVTRFFVLDVTY